MAFSKDFKYFDLTDLWHLAHPHLRPFFDKNEFTADPAKPCLVCGEQHAVRLAAHIRLGNVWQERVSIEFCPDQEIFYLPESGLRERQRLSSLAVDEVPESVNGRLWFSRPTILNIEPTTRCNFSCWYCIGRHMKQEDIDLANFERMLDNFPSLEALALVGEGEPLLHKEFFQMASMAKARNIRVLTISNGSAFSQSVIRQICETEVAYVSISIDSHLPEVFASSRLDGSLIKVWQGINRLREYRDANGFCYPKIGLKGTLFRETQGHLPEIIDMAKSNGVEIFESFQPLNPKETYMSIYPDKMKGEINWINEVAQSISQGSAYGEKELLPFQRFCDQESLPFFPSVIKRPEGRSCDETWLYSLLSGDVTPCCQIKTGFDGRWNIFRDSVQNILSDQDYENLRFNLWNGVFPDYCRGCWKTK